MLKQIVHISAFIIIAFIIVCGAVNFAQRFSEDRKLKMEVLQLQKTRDSLDTIIKTIQLEELRNDTP